jgi:hypothetical protein
MLVTAQDTSTAFQCCVMVLNIAHGTSLATSYTITDMGVFEISKDILFLCRTATSATLLAAYAICVSFKHYQFVYGTLERTYSSPRCYVCAELVSEYSCHNLMYRECRRVRNYIATPWNGAARQIRPAVGKFCIIRLNHLRPTAKMPARDYSSYAFDVTGKSQGH